MKFTLSWLKEHLDSDATLDEITERLTMVGLEVEKVTERARGMESFVVGYVVDAKQHPDADKLSVCRVDNGSETIEVVCGAPNVRTGMKGVFAASGSYIPGTDLTLKPTKIRGVTSNGMLLSEREMDLSDDHDGIIELSDDAPVGASAVKVMNLDDPIIEIAITPNRGDCLGVRGIARDLVAAGLGDLKPLPNGPIRGTFESPIGVHLDFDSDTADACPYFVGRYIRGVQNCASPIWLKARLRAIGLRPISALVDITNLLTMDLARPLHVFDADKVTGNICVRLAQFGEQLLALDGKEYELDDEMTVIADDEKVEGLGGVIGGEESGCTETTTNVFIEAAYFEPTRTAMTGRKLNITSDARYRFERGVDPAFLIDGMEIATRLVTSFCGGEPSKLIIAGAEPDWKRKVILRPDRVRTLGGVDVPLDEIERILQVLGFTVNKESEALRVSVPSWRSDIVGEACLVEEVVRIYGFDKIPAIPSLSGDSLPHPALGPNQRRRNAARRVLAGRGLVEAVTFSFLASGHAELFGEVPKSLRLINPISTDLDVMRPSLLPNLISAAGHGSDRGTRDAALFEVGPQFSGNKPEDEANAVAGIRSGSSGKRNWAEGTRPVDVFDAKADTLSVLSELGAPVDKIQVVTDAPAWYHPGRSGVMRLGPKTVLAYFGEVHPGVLAKMDVKGPMAAFEVFTDNLPKPKNKKSATKPHLDLPQFHAVERDFAFVVDTDVAASAVIGAARSAEKKLITDVTVFDVFSGGNLRDGKKSLAISVTLQPFEKTMSDEEIEAVVQKIVAKVEKATGGTLRS